MNPHKPKLTLVLPERKDFESKYYVDVSGCWLWTGASHSKKWPYGKIRKAGRSFNAHRVSWMLYRGEIPEGQQVLHRCDNPKCVNPEHLFLGTHTDNMQDAVRKKRHKNCTFYGANHPAAKLTEAQVIAIREEKGFLRDLARKYNVTMATISHIRTGKTWRKIAD